MDLITSLRNPKIKQARSLRTRKGRDESGLFLVEGIRHAGEAYEAGAEVTQVFFAPQRLTSAFGQDLVARWQTRGVPCFATTPEVLASLAEKENPQGLLAVARQGWRPLQSLNPEICPWAVALQNPQDPGNIGTILRTADAVGAGALILVDGGADPHHPTAVRASMGALFWHSLAATTSAGLLEWCHSLGYRLYGTSAHGSVDFRAVRTYDQPCVLLLGSEREGLSPALVQASHQLLRLPIQGRVTSLNLAVTAGVLLYDMAAKLSI